MLAKAKLVVVFLVLLNAFFSVGQVNAVYDKTDYNFWISLPADTVLKSKPPILIFLHGVTNLAWDSMEQFIVRNMFQEI